MQSEFYDIVNFIADYSSTLTEREALVNLAFFENRIIRFKTSYEGTPHEYSVNLVHALRKHGEVYEGMQSLWQLLLTLRGTLGSDRQRKIDNFESWANRPNDDLPQEAPRTSKRLTSLTKKEREFLSLVVEGLSHSEVGKELSIDAASVRGYVASIQKKLELPKQEAKLEIYLKEREAPFESFFLELASVILAWASLEEALWRFYERKTPNLIAHPKPPIIALIRELQLRNLITTEQAEEILNWQKIRNRANRGNLKEFSKGYTEVTVKNIKRFIDTYLVE